VRLPELPRDRAGRIGLAAAGAVLWWTLALADIRLLVGLPLVALGVYVARRMYPAPPEPEYDDWF
jgi:hypothetical protein